jgi:Uma2 family endonuclease
MPAVARTYRFTVEEYHKLGEVGIFDEDDRVELLDGEIILMSPVGYRHAKAVRRLNNGLVPHSRRRFQVDVQNPVIVSDDSEPQPDLLLLDPAVDAYEGLPEARHVYLVIEVADATLRYDRGRKLKAYARAGIRELWIVNLREDVIEVYRDPAGEAYRTTRVARGSERVAPAAFPDVKVTVGKIVG